MKTIDGASKFVLDSKNFVVQLTEEFDGPFDGLIQTRWLHLVTIFVKPNDFAKFQDKYCLLKKRASFFVNVTSHKNDINLNILKY